MKLSLILLALLIAGCSSHRTRVDCDGKLKPINTPALAVAKAATAVPGSTP